jgi:cytochrome b561
MVHHGLIALLLIALVMLGLYMAGLPDVGFDTRKLRLILYHKELGILALTLVAPRLLWRLSNERAHTDAALGWRSRCGGADHAVLRILERVSPSRCNGRIRRLAR